jgi:hypothetical protein
VISHELRSSLPSRSGPPSAAPLVHARLAVLAIVIAAGLAGLGCSALLLWLGVGSMGPRWIVAVLAAYSAFLLLVRAFLVPGPATAPRRAPALDSADVLDATTDLARAVRPATWTGDGGTFSGGGASVHLDGANDGGEAALDVATDPEAWPIVAGVALAALTIGSFVAAGWVVYAAPELVADLIADAVATGVVYRRLRVRRAAWWATAVRHTWAPAALTLIAFAVAGFVLDAYVPGADTLRQVLVAVRTALVR